MTAGTLPRAARLSRHRATAAISLVTYAAAVGVLRFATTGGGTIGHVLALAIIPAAITAVLIGVMLPSTRFDEVVAEMEEARDREAELAVARERVRFASDLHDIQGHTLHVVRLKIALAQRLLHNDLARVEEELREMYTLVGATITQTKELATGRQTLNLSAELQNATNLLEAVDIDVQIDCRPSADTPASGLLAQVLRETTTNILRHSRATQVRIALSDHHITVVNDGVIDDEVPELRGLAALTDRVEEEGGSLTVDLLHGRFVTAATFGEPSVSRVAAEVADRQ